ncbi:hypothetical protein ACEPPN_005672 [Leptodophora sp. 'Broadleaf-Isolate-01']
MKKLPGASKLLTVAEKNVSDATANKPYNPPKTLLSKIVAQTSSSPHEYLETVAFLNKELQCTNRKWRCCFKALVVVEYLLSFGNENFVGWAKENLESIEALQHFSHDDVKATFRVRYAAKQVVLLLSVENTLQSKRREGKGWISLIPQIHDFDALYTSYPEVIAQTKDIERDASRTHKFHQKSLTEAHPPSLSRAVDRVSLRAPVDPAAAGVWENSAVAERHTQNSPGRFLPDAIMSPQVSLMSPVTVGTPDTSIANATSRDRKLGDYFQQAENATRFTDVQCRDVARLLHESMNVSWSLAPRLYIILRTIGQLQVLDAFLDLGVNDLWLPLSESAIPPALSVAYHSEFIKAQSLVLSKALCLENSTGGHAHFTGDDPLPFERKETLGEGRFGSVDRVLSSLSGREFARKRFRRRKVGKTELASFMNEVKILKRLNHIHCVAFIASYTDPKYFGIIMAPVADHDLNTFYQFVSPENAPLLRSFFGCLAGALNFLHEAKIRHRDIKPQNILVKGAHVYLTDFGVSLDWENLSRSTTTEDSAKTPLYCAPEVARWEKRNTSADIWSLGCVFLEMLTLLKNRTVEEQRQYFRKRTDTALFHKNVSSAREWVEQLRKTDPTQDSDSFLADCILQLLKENPDERLRTAELYNGLSSYRDLDIEKENPLCGECCVSDAVSVSDGGSDSDPFADMTEGYRDSVNTRIGSGL